MAKKLTKNTLPVNDYQIWTSGNMSEGDILDVYGSLGGRIADSVTFETSSGNSIVQLNVATEVYAEHGYHSQVSGVVHNPWVGRGAGATRSSPYLVKEIEKTWVPQVLVETGTAQSWTRSEIGVRDIKIVTDSGLRIIVT